MSRSSGVRLWWRHRGWTAALAVQLVCLAWAVAGSGVRLQVPPLLSGAGVEVANAAVIPMVTAIAAGWALGRRDVELEASRRRPVRWWDVVVAGGLAASYLATALLVPDRTLLVVACRNAAGLVGLSLLALGLGLVRMGSALPIGYVVVSLFCGQMEMRKAVWSWPVKHAGDPIAAVLAGALFALGGAVYLWRTPRTGSADEDL